MKDALILIIRLAMILLAVQMICSSHWQVAVAGVILVLLQIPTILYYND